MAISFNRLFPDILLPSYVEVSVKYTCENPISYQPTSNPNVISISLWKKGIISKASSSSNHLSSWICLWRQNAFSHIAPRVALEFFQLDLQICPNFVWRTQLIFNTAFCVQQMVERRYGLHMFCIWLQSLPFTSKSLLKHT